MNRIKVLGVVQKKSCDVNASKYNQFADKARKIFVGALINRSANDFASAASAVPGTESAKIAMEISKSLKKIDRLYERLEKAEREFE